LASHCGHLTASLPGLLSANRDRTHCSKGYSCSITSSAVASGLSGAVRPSILAGAWFERAIPRKSGVTTRQKILDPERRDWPWPQRKCWSESRTPTEKYQRFLLGPRDFLSGR